MTGGASSGNHHPVALAQAEMALEPLTTLRSSGSELKSLEAEMKSDLLMDGKWPIEIDGLPIKQWWFSMANC